jgi:hypothetical protein
MYELLLRNKTAFLNAATDFIANLSPFSFSYLIDGDI